MVKKQRQPRGTNVTKERYEIVKQLHTAGVTNTKIASTLGYSDTTISRMVRSDDFEHYQRIQRDHAKKLANNQPKPEVTPVAASVQGYSSDNSEVVDKLERIAVALEGLVEAWNRGGNEKKGLFR